MEHSPAFQFYAGDWLSSARVQLLTLEEEGAYIRALCYCWKTGSVPADPEMFMRLIGKGGSTTVATKVQAMFTADPSNPSILRHDRLDLERQKQLWWREKSREGGLKSGKNRRNQAKTKGGSTTVPTKGQPAGCQMVEPNGNSSVFSLQSSSSPSGINPPSGGVGVVDSEFGGNGEQKQTIDDQVREFVGKHSALSYDKATHSAIRELAERAGWKATAELICRAVKAKANRPAAWALEVWRREQTQREVRAEEDAKIKDMTARAAERIKAEEAAKPPPVVYVPVPRQPRPTLKLSPERMEELLRKKVAK